MIFSRCQRIAVIGGQKVHDAVRQTFSLTRPDARDQLRIATTALDAAPLDLRQAHTS